MELFIQYAYNAVPPIKNKSLKKIISFLLKFIKNIRTLRVYHLLDKKYGQKKKPQKKTTTAHALLHLCNKHTTGESGTNVI